MYGEMKRIFKRNKKLSFKKRFLMAIERDKQSMMNEENREFVKVLQSMAEEKKDKK